MEALRKTREMRQKYEHLVDDSDNRVSRSNKLQENLLYKRKFQHK